MKKALLLVVCSTFAASSIACIGFERKSTVTGPSAAGVNTLLGSWSSSNVIPSPSSCTDFKWNVTEQTGNSASGTFSATCANDLKVAGNAKGTLSGSTISWVATAKANAPGRVQCDISLIGTAEIQVDSIRVPYAGDTCAGKVTGVEILRRK
ncbi:MAG: hypothetical protein ACRD15_03185 [Vicinamibacterales bacterium]